MNAEIHLPVRVYIEDTDAGGIVYYVNYLKFMERARTELLRALGYGKAALFADELMFVVHSLGIQYQKPARLDDELSILARIVRAGRAWFQVEQAVYRGDELLCRAEVKIACVAREGLRPTAIPTVMRNHIQQLLQAETSK